MDKHVKILGFLNLAWGLMGLLAMLVVLMIFFGGFMALGLFTGDEEPIMVAGVLGSVFAVIGFIASVPSLLAAYGLLQRRSWGRVVAIIVGILNLAAFPFGTALGVYTLIILLDSDSERVFSKRPQIAH